MEKIIMDVYSIDSWSDGDGGWSENQRYGMGSISLRYESDKTFDRAFRAMLSREFIRKGARVTVEDYAWPSIYVNLKSTGEQLYTFEVRE